MRTIYYNDMVVISDKFRKLKYEKILILSLVNDTSKWKKKLSTSNTAYYISPNYNDSYFVIENANENTRNDIAFIKHKKSIIPKEMITFELISDNFNKELLVGVKKLREQVYTSELNDIEKLISKNTKNDRKEKLQFIEYESVKKLILDTYQDWLDSKSIISAKLIAKIIYSYRKNDVLYKLWLEKFNIKLILTELDKLKK